MKLEKIKFIECPNKDVRLGIQTMANLLGGTYCGVLNGNHCENYYTSPSCDSTTTVRCGSFSW